MDELELVFENEQISDSNSVKSVIFDLSFQTYCMEINNEKQ